ncbi:MAG: MFS transporter [Acinetobacter sp.]
MRHSIYTPTILLMAISAGVCAGGNYFSQPLVHSMSQNLRQPETVVAWVPTLAQVAYSIGLLLLTPLGDIVEKRRLVLIFMLLASAGLLLCGALHDFSMLLVGTIITGLFSSASQLLLPLAASSVPLHKSGQAVGFVISAMMLGVLLARSLSGLMSSLFSWYFIYLICSGILLACALVLYRSLDAYPAESKRSYAHTLRNLWNILRQHKRLQLRTLVGAVTFASLSTAFVTMSLLLVPEPFHFSDFHVGLFGMVGIFGAIMANFSGRYIDRGYGYKISLIFSGGMMLSWLLFSLVYHSMLFYGMATILLYASMSAIHVTNQSIVFKLAGSEKSSFNAIYMTGYYWGGALGTSLSVLVWKHFAWNGVCIFGFGLAILGLWLCIKDQQYAKNMA